MVKLSKTILASDWDERADMANKAPSWLNSMDKVERYTNAISALTRSGFSLQEAFDMVDEMIKKDETGTVMKDSREDKMRQIADAADDFDGHFDFVHADKLDALLEKLATNKDCSNFPKFQQAKKG